VRIASSNILLSSTHSASASQQIEERLRVRESDHRPDVAALEHGDGTAPRRDMTSDAVTLSERVRSAATALLQAPSATAPTTQPDALPSEDEAKLLMLQKLLEQISGKKIAFKVLRFEASASATPTQAAAEKLQRAVGEAHAARIGNEGAGLVVQYDRTEHYEESERTTFASTGMVRTADGKELAVSVDVTMSRAFVAHNEEHLLLDNTVRQDPLVINFGGNATQLTTDKFSFDIDTDGAVDQLSFVQPGSGFLAMDTNGDGTIKNGKELFGPTTGDGFAELAAYDTDDNHWIDEGDAVFNRLRIWTKDADGTDRLLALGQVGVGAIYLGNVATPFSVNDAANRQLGLVQSTGIWLGEQGGAGTVQHVDLVV
jgi:hypothetical protein